MSNIDYPDWYVESIVVWAGPFILIGNMIKSHAATIAPPRNVAGELRGLTYSSPDRYVVLSCNRHSNVALYVTWSSNRYSNVALDVTLSRHRNCDVALDVTWSSNRYRNVAFD